MVEKAKAALALVHQDKGNSQKLGKMLEHRQFKRKTAQLSLPTVHRGPLLLLTIRSSYVCAEASLLPCLNSLAGYFLAAHTNIVSACHGSWNDRASGNTYETTDARERVMVKLAPEN